MATTTKNRAGHRCITIAVLAAAFLVLTALAAAPAMGTAGEEQQGAQLLRSLQTGKEKCTSLTTDNFELIGEYVMGRMFGSSAAHDAMNRQMVSTMGNSGESQAHVFMGKRFAGCATGQAPAAFGAMMGMMGAGMMGSAYGGPAGANPGMMGSGSRGAGGMMGLGYNSRASGGDNGWNSGDTVMVVLMVLLIALAIAALVALLVRGGITARGDTPNEVLTRRLAAGSISVEEYERLRAALESAPPTGKDSP